MGRLWAMDQVISKRKEVGRVKCAALRKSIFLGPSLIIPVMIIFVTRH